MKIAFYMDEGREQIVLTPESEFEKAMLGKLHESNRQLSIHRGEFYACQGGWTRWRDVGPTEACSTMLVLNPLSAGDSNYKLRRTTILI